MDAGHNFASFPAPKVKMERKYVEKNRRNQMKTLYFKLASLLPSHISKEGLSVPDQIDEAVNYIKSLQMALEKSKENKEMLKSTRKGAEHACNSTEHSTAMSTTKIPQIEVQEMGPNLYIVLLCGLDGASFCFYDIMRVLREQGAQVVHANFSTSGNSIFHILYEKIGEATSISKRLKDALLVHGKSSYTQVGYPQLDLSDI